MTALVWKQKRTKQITKHVKNKSHLPTTATLKQTKSTCGQQNHMYTEFTTLCFGYWKCHSEFKVHSMRTNNICIESRRYSMRRKQSLDQEAIFSLIQYNR